MECQEEPMEDAEMRMRPSEFQDEESLSGGGGGRKGKKAELSRTRSGEYKKMFRNAVKKNNVIHKIQVLQEEKDVVKEMELTKASEGARGFKERFRRSRPNSVCDPLDMIPASEGQQQQQQQRSSVARAETVSIDHQEQEEEMEEEIEEELECEDEEDFVAPTSRTTASIQQT